MLRKIGEALIAVAIMIYLGFAGGTPVTVVQGPEPRNLDPTMAIGKACIMVQHAILDPLVYHSLEGEALKTVPWLALSWERLQPYVWRIRLREGVKFHNGEPFNAQSVAFSIDTYNHSTGEGKSFFQYVERVEILDDYTLDIYTKEPSAIVPETLSLLYVLPPDYYTKVGSDGFNAHPIGTGPFVFCEWEKGRYIKVRANKEYWHGAPKIEEVYYRWAPEASTRIAMLLSGEADIVTDVPPEMTEQIKKSNVARIEWVPSLRKMFVEFYRGEPPFNDVRVRKAANYAVDKEALINYVLGGMGAVRKGVILPGWVGYNPDALISYEYDPAKARRLLNEAGYPQGVTVDFWYPIGRYLKDKEVAEAIANMLNAVGIQCRMHGMDISSLCQKVHTQTLSGMHFFSMAPLYNDPDYLWRCQFWSKGLNQYAADAVTDVLIELGVSTADISCRSIIYQKLEQYIVNELVPWIFLYDQPLIYGVSNRLEWQPRPDEIVELRNASLKD